MAACDTCLGVASAMTVEMFIDCICLDTGGSLNGPTVGRPAVNTLIPPVSVMMTK